MSRLFSAAVIVAVAVGLVILSWPQLFGLARAPLAAQVVSLRGLGIAVAVVLAVALTLIALLARSARRFAASLAVLLLAFGAINGVVLATRGFGSIAFETKSDASVTVLSWNTLGDAPGAEVIADLALQSGADILTLPETTNETGIAIAEIMKAAGTPMWVYTVAYDQVSKARSTTLLVSAELGEYTVDESAETTAVLPTVVATPKDGTGPTIISVHTVAPIPPMMVVWQQDLAWAAAACAGDNVIMAGDFNATLDHLGDIQHAPGATLGNCADAGLASDNAAVGTWPTALPALLGAPIDHVMTTANWSVTGMRVIQSVDGNGSDHRPLLVQLTPSGQ